MKHPSTFPHLRAALTAALAFAAVLVLGGVASASESFEKQERRLMTLLSAYEYVPNKKVLDRVGPDVDLLLVRIAGHPKLRPTVRVRAMSSMALYPNPRVQGFLRSLLHERRLKGTPLGVLLRRQAMRSLAWAFGDAAVDDLAPLRQDADPQIREACARAYGDSQSRRAIALLEAWLPHEPELFVRSAVDDALQRLKRTTRDEVNHPLPEEIER